MTPLDAIHAQLACSFCRNEIGRFGVIIDERVRMCARCAPRVKEAIEEQMGIAK